MIDIIGDLVRELEDGEAFDVTYGCHDCDGGFHDCCERAYEAEFCWWYCCCGRGIQR